MSLARRMARENRIALAAVGAALLAAALLHGLAVRPLQAGVARAAARAAAASAALSQRDADRRAAQARLARRTRAGERLRQFHDEILPRDLAAARSLTYARLATLAARRDLLLERRTSAGDAGDDGGLARLRTNMRLAGQYADIRRFIEALETAPEFLVIDEVVLSQRGERSDAGLVLTLGVSTYYRAENGA